MSKSLEAFQRIKRYIKEACNPFDYPDNKPHLDIIEKELEEKLIVDMFIQELIDFFGITNLDELKDKICKESIVLEIIRRFFWVEDFQDFIAFNGRLPKSFKEEYDLLNELTSKREEI